MVTMKLAGEIARKQLIDNIEAEKRVSWCCIKKYNFVWIEITRLYKEYNYQHICFIFNNGSTFHFILQKNFKLATHFNAIFLYYFRNSFD